MKNSFKNFNSQSSSLNLGEVNDSPMMGKLSQNATRLTSSKAHQNSRLGKGGNQCLQLCLGLLVPRTVVKEHMQLVLAHCNQMMGRTELHNITTKNTTTVRSAKKNPLALPTKSCFQLCDLSCVTQISLSILKIVQGEYFKFVLAHSSNPAQRPRDTFATRKYGT